MEILKLLKTAVVTESRRTSDRRLPTEHAEF